MAQQAERMEIKLLFIHIMIIWPENIKNLFTIIVK